VLVLDSEGAGHRGGLAQIANASLPTHRAGGVLLSAVLLEIEKDMSSFQNELIWSVYVFLVRKFCSLPVLILQTRKTNKQQTA
jgi:hypothetical protein